jgi:hypothetical protein
MIEDEAIRQRAEWILSGLHLGCSLTAWKREFIENIEERLDDDLSLSERQLSKLEEIYRKNW